MRRDADRGPTGPIHSAWCWCGKVRYEDRKSARRAARRFRDQSKALRAYRAHGGWHLTSASANQVAWYRTHGKEIAS